MGNIGITELEKFTKYKVGYFKYATDELIGYSDDFDDIESATQLASQPVFVEYYTKIVIEDVVRWKVND